MNQENRKTRVVLTVLADGVLLVASLVLAYLIRFELFHGEPNHAPLPVYLRVGVATAPLFLLLYGLRGLYEGSWTRTGQKEFELLFTSNLLGTLLLIAVFFLFKNVDISRWVLVIFFGVSTLLDSLLRLGARRAETRRLRQGIGVRTVLLIGSGEAAEMYLRAVEQSAQLGYRVLGCVTDGAPPEGCPSLGSLWDMDSVLEARAPDEVVAALSARETSAIADVIAACEKAGVKLSVIPYYARHLPARPYIDSVGGVPLMNLRRIPLDNVVNAFVKRLMDLVGAAVLVVLTSPLMLLAAVGTRLSSPGPVIFRQTRVGRDKKPFTMLKFRSMRLNDASDTAWTTDDDPRKTRFGAFLRKFSIDELPQLFNVLRGDMSLVGPRPELPHFVEQFRESVPMYMLKHLVRPGITGWAQVCGLRGDTSIPDRIRHDVWYIENWSLLLDIKILFMTLTRAFVNPEKLTAGKKA